ncbi:carboxypeptidase regulatory-like domain-containing protein [Pseudenhygromyxa sp. WMMC2535]|uniref:carboxypeptidase regulatory-like domain-containing protein n=1 Tax=Pseudenhygromyxa sp. WMMC2535 TaxID=2712867 RepID=UPI00155828C2|nr:carboxypeptidase regulatory-like domain-containing protein [Pseudenhygromyxa sp. WMMC2535]NVB42603.1 carboxypeptidase regulatory-like domain-containing protein [Pseudenhygromyxa sp. WMMC2535]
MAGRSQKTFSVLGFFAVVGTVTWWFVDLQMNPREQVANDPQTPQTPIEDEPQPPATPALEDEPKAILAGTISDLDGQGLAEAQVCAWPSAAELAGRAAEPSCVTTGDDGSYRIEGLWPVSTRIEASAREFLPAAWGERSRGHRRTLAHLQPGETLDGLDLSLSPGGQGLVGVVRDVSGEAIADAWVTVQASETGPRVLARSDAEGNFTLWGPSGAVYLSAAAEGHAAHRQRTAIPNAEASVELVPESVISGRVVLADSGEAVPGVVVEAGGQLALSDAEGNFRVTQLQPGDHALVAHGATLYGRAQPVHLGLAETRDAVTVSVHPAQRVEGTVVTTGGDPCPDGELHLRHLDFEGERRSAKIGREGAVELLAVLPGRHAVELSCPGYATPEDGYPELEVSAEDLTGQRWEVSEGLAIRGALVEAKGRQPAAGLRVRAQLVDDPDFARTSSPSDAEGGFELAGLPAGSYELWVVSSTGEPLVQKPQLTELQDADLEALQVVAPGAGVLAGSLRDKNGPLAGVLVEATREGARLGYTAVTDAQGDFRIEGVQSGNLRVIAYAGDGPDAPVLRAPKTSDADRQGRLAWLAPGKEANANLLVEPQAGTISGQVLDAEGTALADALVVAQRLPDGAPAGHGRARFASDWRLSAPVRSDADGRFTLEGLSEGGSYVLAALRPGGGEVVVEPIATGEEAELRIAAAGELSGRVALTEGGTPDYLVLELRAADGTHRHAALYRPSEGAFHFGALPPGTYDLEARTPTASANLWQLELAPGASLDELVATAHPRVLARGQLVDADTRAPIPGLKIAVHAYGEPLDEAQAARLAAPSEGPGEPGQDTTDAEGRFALEDVTSGWVTLVLTSTDPNPDKNPYHLSRVGFELSGEGEEQELGELELFASRAGKKGEVGELGFEIAAVAVDTEVSELRYDVSAVDERSPAAKAGLAVGDVIESVDGHELAGHPFRFERLIAVGPWKKLTLGLADGREVVVQAGKARQ